MLQEKKQINNNNVYASLWYPREGHGKIVWNVWKHNSWIPIGMVQGVHRCSQFEYLREITQIDIFKTNENQLGPWVAWHV
jgi:hypothetical protein